MNRHHIIKGKYKKKLRSKILNKLKIKGSNQEKKLIKNHDQMNENYFFFVI